MTEAFDDRLRQFLPAPCLAGETLWIGGRWEKASSGETIGTVDPSTGRHLFDLARGASADIDRAAKAADDAVPGWAALGGTGRATILRKAAEILRASGSACSTPSTAAVPWRAPPDRPATPPSSSTTMPA